MVHAPSDILLVLYRKSNSARYTGRAAHGIGIAMVPAAAWKVSPQEFQIAKA